MICPRVARNTEVSDLEQGVLARGVVPADRRFGGGAARSGRGDADRSTGPGAAMERLRKWLSP
jgi:hypothetical protein